MKIGVKLFLAFLILSVATLLANLLLYDGVRRTTIERALDHLVSVASAQQARLLDNIDHNRERVLLVASRTQLRLSLQQYLRDGQRQHQERMHRILSDARDAIPSFLRIDVRTLAGTVVASTDPAAVGQPSPSHEEECFLAGQQRPTVTHLWRAPDGRLSLHLAAPLSLDNELLGVLLIDANADSIFDAVTDYAGLGRSGETVLATRTADGDALLLMPARFDDQAAMQRTVPAGTANSALLLAVEGNNLALADAVDYRGKAVLAVSRSLDTTGWGLVVKIDREEALAPLEHFRTLFFGVIGCSILIIIVTAFYLGNALSRPITKLTQAVQAFSSRGEAMSVDIPTQDEIGTLAQAFNTMTARLAASTAELAANHERLEKLFSSSHVLFAFMDTEFNFVKVNQAYAEADGHNPEYFIGKNHFDLYPDPANQAIFRQVVATGTPHTSYAKPFTYSGTPECGVTYWDWSLTPLLAPDGKVEGVCLALVNVTRHIRAEEQLHLTQFSVDSVQDAIFWIDRDARFQFVNDAACRRLGYSRKELLTMGVFDVDPTFPREKWAEHWQQTMDKGSLTIETRHRTKEGEAFPVEVTTNRVEYGDNQYNCAIARDISHRKQIEEQLMRAKEQWERTFEAIGDIAIIQDTEHRIVRVNRKACETLHASAEELQGKYCYEVFRGIAEPCEGCPAFESLQDFEVHTGEIEHQSLGKIFKVSASPVVDNDGKISGVIHFAQDITAQRQLEKQLSQAQKMEAIGTLAGGIAHDFNNILTPILGFAEMALEDLPPESRTSADLKQVIQSAGRAKELVKQILTFSRQSGEDLRPLQVQLVVKEALKLLRATIPTSIEIRSKIDSDCGLVLGDPTQVLQIVMNLCTNAYHAMREAGGVLTVRLLQVECNDKSEKPLPASLQPGSHVLIEVSDTGHGMDEIVLERIFEPYYTTKGKGEGTGLGLSVVHGIVRSLHGEITVRSTPGQGTVFEVYLPMITAASPNDKDDGGSVGLPHGTERVLVVDDEETIVVIETKMLASLGYRVSPFTDCEEALRAFRVHPDDFDLIITDMNMPKITGARFAEEVFSVRPEKPVIICTGFSDQLSEAEAKAMGIRAYLLKPVLRKKLATTIRRVLDDDRQ